MDTNQYNQIQNIPTTAQNNKNHSTDHHKKDPFAQKKIEKAKKSIFGFFVTRTRLTILLIIGIILLGGVALTNIPRESDPEVKIPIAVVTTVFSGASPADIENLITDRIESKIEELDNIKLVTSNSSLSVSSVVVEFEAEADLDDSIRSLKDKVLEITGLPDDANDPRVIEIRANDYPIITFSLAGPLKEEELKALGESLQLELEKIPGVSDVPLLGARDREFSVIANQAALNRLNIPITAIANAVAVANADAPLGSINIDSTNYSVRAVAKIDSLEKLKKTVVTIANGQPILLEDVAEVKDQFAEKTNMARLSIDGQPSVNTISLQILKKTGGNILNIVDTAKERVEKFQTEGMIPPEVDIEISSDYSTFIRDDLKTLGTSGLTAVVLIFIILFLALSIREAAISLLAIPLTFLITFFVLNFRGDTLNSLSLFSLVLSLGLLVDAFIIMLEGVFHNLRMGYESKDAALLSISHYKNPLISGAFTTISAFIPMLLVSGIMGEYLKVLPITISTVLLASLFVSLALVPAIASLMLKCKKCEDGSYKPPKTSFLEKYLTNRLTKIYCKKIETFLRSRKQKLAFMGVIILLFLGSLGLLIGGTIPVELFPEMDVDFSMIDIELPIGTDMDATNKLVQEVESYLYTRDDIKVFATSIGSSSSFGFGPTSAGENVANINITFVDEKLRDQKSYEINNEMRDDLASITKGKIAIREITGGPPTGSPIEVRITGDELEIIDELATKLISTLENTEGVIDIESDKAISPADFTFKLNHETLAKSGLGVAEVSGFLRTAIFGLTATEITIDGEDIDVIVKLDEQNIDSIEKIKNLSITNRQGQSVKLSRVADFSLEPALATIRHRDFKRTTSIRANLESSFAPSQVVPQIEEKIASEYIPEGYELNFGGEVEDIEQSFSELWNAMIVAVLLILFILVLQFNSFKKPLVILLSLLPMLIGVVIGMLIFRLPFSFSVFLGLISLAGIGVNDAIVLLDKTNRNVTEQKMNPIEAVSNAGATRLQPILLTTITTIAGIVPLAFADEFWLGLSISIIFGLGFGMILQLFVVPIIYLKLEGKTVLKQQSSN